MKISKLFVTKIVVISTLILFLMSCKDKSETGNTSDIFITLDKTEYYPFDVVLVQLSVAATAQEYMGELSGNSITAVRFADSTLAVVLPYLEAADYTLSIKIGNDSFENNLKIKALPQVNDSEAVIDEIQTILSDILAEAKQENDPNTPFLEEVLKIFNQELSNLTNEERKQLAAYWQVHSEIFNLPDLDMKGWWDDLKDGIEKIDNNYAISVMFFSGAVAAFAPLAIAAYFHQTARLLLLIDAAIIKKMYQRNNKIMREAMDKVFIPTMDFLNLKNTTEYDYTVKNDETLTFNPTITCRSICADDILGNSPAVAKSIIGTTNLFIVVFEDFVEALENLREKFSSVPKLSGRPQDISEITTPRKTETISIDDWTLQIVSGNVSAQKISNNSYRFSTTATDNVEFTFKIFADVFETNIISALLEVDNTCDQIHWIVGNWHLVSTTITHTFLNMEVPWGEEEDFSYTFVDPAFPEYSINYTIHFYPLFDRPWASWEEWHSGGINDLRSLIFTQQSCDHPFYNGSFSAPNSSDPSSHGWRYDGTDETFYTGGRLSHYFTGSFVILPNSNGNNLYLRSTMYDITYMITKWSWLPNTTSSPCTTVIEMRFQ